MPLILPYELGLWVETPVVYIMDPQETVAEKILGWCAHRRVKHYADLAYITLVSLPQMENRRIELNYSTVLDVLEKKRKRMAALQPGMYAHLPNLAAVIGDLAREPQFNAKQWGDLLYVSGERQRFTQKLISDAVRKFLVPGLRKAMPR